MPSYLLDSDPCTFQHVNTENMHPAADRRSVEITMQDFLPNKRGDPVWLYSPQWRKGTHSHRNFRDRGTDPTLSQRISMTEFSWALTQSPRSYTPQLACTLSRTKLAAETRKAATASLRGDDRQKPFCSWHANCSWWLNGQNSQEQQCRTGSPTEMEWASASTSTNLWPV